MANDDLKNLNQWDGLHHTYTQTEWIDKPNIFAEQVLEYLPHKGALLDLGSGQGQDSRFFASKGYDVTSMDISAKALGLAQSKAIHENSPKIHAVKGDISQKLPFEDNAFTIVYAHLSLHYFDSPTTRRILKEIHRVLKPSGVVAIFTNSTTDPEYGNGTMLDDEFFIIEGTPKRYFSTSSIKTFTHNYFDEILIDSKGETYKDSAKGVHHLIRYIGKNK